MKRAAKQADGEEMFVKDFVNIIFEGHVRVRDVKRSCDTLKTYEGQITKQYCLGFAKDWDSSVDQDPLARDPYSDIYDTNDTGYTGDTCLGEGYNDDTCRDVGDADNYTTHTLSVTYQEDNWAVNVGVRNIFNKEPPRVDGSEVSSVNNVPIGYGYDLMGRSLYVNFEYQLGNN